MTERCRIDCKEMKDIKKTLYGPDGTRGLVGCVKKKVSWTTVCWFLGVFVPAVIVLGLTFNTAKTQQLEDLHKSQARDELKLEKLETIQKVVVDNQVKLRKELKEERIREREYRKQRALQRARDVEMILKAIEKVKR